MPLAWCYGFEMGSLADLATNTGQATVSLAPVDWVGGGSQHGSAVTGAGSYCWRMTFAANGRVWGMFDAGNDYWLSIAYYWTSDDSNPVSTPLYATNGAGSNFGWIVRRVSSRTLQLAFNDGTSANLVATSTLLTSNNVWQTLALKATKSGNDYSAEVYIDGTLFMSGTYTFAGTSYGFGGFGSQGASGSGNYSYVDDVRVFTGDMAGDAAAAKAEGYVFAGHVSADSVDGSFTPSTGTDLYPCVEMGPSTDWAKSISTTTDGDVCRLAMDSIGGAISGTADGVVVHIQADTDSGLDDITAGMAETSVATPVYGTATDCQTKTLFSTAIQTSDGSTAWTQASFDAANVVIKATS